MWHLRLILNKIVKIRRRNARFQTLSRPRVARFARALAQIRGLTETGAGKETWPPS